MESILPNERNLSSINDYLNDDCLREILAYLADDPISLNACTRVCRVWMSFTTSTLWRDPWHYFQLGSALFGDEPRKRLLTCELSSIAGKSESAHASRKWLPALRKLDLLSLEEWWWDDDLTDERFHAVACAILCHCQNLLAYTHNGSMLDSDDFLEILWWRFHRLHALDVQGASASDILNSLVHTEDDVWRDSQVMYFMSAEEREKYINTITIRRELLTFSCFRHHLRSLRISEVRLCNDTFDFLGTMANLESLAFIRCSCLTTEDLFQVFYYGRITEFEVMDGTMEQELLSMVGKMAPLLRKLSFHRVRTFETAEMEHIYGFADGLLEVARGCPRLAHLEWDLQEVEEDAFRKLIRARAPVLEVLHLTLEDINPLLIQEDVAKICQRLRVLEMLSWHVNDSLLRAIVPRLDTLVIADSHFAVEDLTACTMREVFGALRMLDLEHCRNFTFFPWSEKEVHTILPRLKIVCKPENFLAPVVRERGWR